MNIEVISMWLTLLGNFGFPAVFSLYLLVKFERKVAGLTKEIECLIERFDRNEND
ncbi:MULTISPECIES: YvrJ family protein [Bacillaceae]|uniref:Trk-type K+ transport system membrane component n=1 Tax=Peribacillus huizhouensis TaxID=1501239 RepID=A0ABR6CPL4_9BACI|nr:MULTISPECIES: YvrJ family protein [Bacillaceae]MBA9026959.1 Trk-type K+ transport system membrane component [Peribacillus huizhouensis]